MLFFHLKQTEEKRRGQQVRYEGEKTADGVKQMDEDHGKRKWRAPLLRHHSGRKNLEMRASVMGLKLSSITPSLCAEKERKEAFKVRHQDSWLSPE